MWIASLLLIHITRLNPGSADWCLPVRSIWTQTIHHDRIRRVYCFSVNPGCHAGCLCSQWNQQSRTRLGGSGFVYDRHLLLPGCRVLRCTILHRNLPDPHTRKGCLLLCFCQQCCQPGLSRGGTNCSPEYRMEVPTGEFSSSNDLSDAWQEL